MNRIEQVTARMTEIDQQQAGLETDAQSLNAGLFTDGMRAVYDGLAKEYDTLKAEKLRLTAGGSSGRLTLATSGSPLNSFAAMSMHSGRPVDDDDDDDERGHRVARLKGDVQQWHNLANGQPISVFSPRARMSNKPEHACSLGKYMRGVATGNWKNSGLEKALALSEGGTGGGHFLVPDELSTQWVDLARASSVLVRAGMPTVQMNSETMSIARVDDDPNFTVVAENVALGDTDVEIGSTMLVARKIGCIVTASRELMADAPNAPEIIEKTMARALAAEIDRLGLVGNGGSEGIDGLVIHSGVGSTGSVGAITWEDFITATTGVREYNYEPTAIILHPTIHSDAMAITSGDGTNSAKLWLNAPPHVANVPFLTTTAIGTSYAVAGDFAHVLMGVRTGATLETTTVGDESFEKHQVRFKITQRLAFAVTRPTAFHVLSGITT